MLFGCLFCLTPGSLMAAKSPAIRTDPSQSHGERSTVNGERFRILASFLPVYVLTGNIVKGVPGVSVELMLPPGTGCPHEYMLTPGDLKKIAGSSVLVVNGLGLEEFAGRPVMAANPGIKVIDASQDIKPLKDTGDGHEHRSHSDHVNAHVWTSPALYLLQARNITEALATIDPGHADLYRRNGAQFTGRLEKLADEVKSTRSSVRGKKIILYHGAFDYLARDLELDLVAHIEEHPGHYPSAGKLDALIRTAKKEKVAAIFAETHDSLRYAKLLSGETGIPFFVLDALTGTGKTVGPDYYETVMRKNLAIIRKSLGVR
ncbi:MAG: metal ABC transporter substrate-binding protein [Pseudomonadota bacterium]